MNPAVTQEFAKWQDKVFACDERPPIADVLKWMLICIAQEEICVTNLTLRMRVITRDLFMDRGLPFVENQFSALHRNLYWLEGYSYWLYVRVALDWYKRVTGRDIVDADIVEAIQSNYESLRAPDGSIPLPECA